MFLLIFIFGVILFLLLIYVGFWGTLAFFLIIAGLILAVKWILKKIFGG